MFLFPFVKLYILYLKKCKFTKATQLNLTKQIYFNMDFDSMLMGSFASIFINSAMYSLPAIWIISLLILWSGYFTGKDESYYKFFALPIPFYFGYLYRRNVIIKTITQVYWDFQHRYDWIFIFYYRDCGCDTLFTGRMNK